MRKSKKYKMPKKYPNAARLAKEYNERNSRKTFRIDKKLPVGVLWSYRGITLSLLALTLIFAVFRAPIAYQRLIRGLHELYDSIIFYSLMFKKEVVYNPIINELPDINFGAILPFNLEELRNILSVYFECFFSTDFFYSYMYEVSERAPFYSLGIIMFILFLISFKLIIDLYVSKANGRWFEKTRLFKLYEKIYVKIYFPVKIYIQTFFIYQRGHYYFTILKVLWLLNFNVIVVPIGALAYFFYFSRAFDLSSFYIQLYKLFLDVGIVLYLIPIPILIFFISKFIFRWQKKTGGVILRHQNALNIALLDKLSMSSLITAAMGGGKTSMAVVLALLLSCKFRNDALGIMYKYYKYFYRFPWSKFRKKLDYAIKQHYIYNLATIEAYFEELKSDFYAHPCPQNIFGYDIEHYDLFYNNGLYDVYIWDALETYAEAYFVYVMETSLIAANFPIREDYLIINAGNMIYYDYDFYSHPVDPETSHFSHILNWDTLRMGKTMVADSAYRNSFEFGIIVATEEGKERPNALETLTVKPTADECNQKNDMVPHRLKMSRHGGTIDNINFFAKIGDEQRAVDVSAPMREVSNEVSIEESTESRVAFPLFVFPLMLRDFFSWVFRSLNDEYDKCHGEVGFFMQIIRDISLLVIRPIDRIIEAYSYRVLTIKIGKCSDDNSGYAAYRFYLQNIVAFKKRYSTDTHRSHFREFGRRAPGGLNDSPTFTTLRPTNEQLLAANSLWLQKMIELGEINDDTLYEDD